MELIYLYIENYKNIPVITLFGKKNKFSDPGGYIDKGETPEETACRECREETCNLINLKPKQLHMYGTPLMVNEYMTYIIYVKNLFLFMLKAPKDTAKLK